MNFRATSWWEAFETKLKDYPAWLIDVSIFGIAGIIAGYVIKNFGKLLLLAGLALVIILWLFNYLDLLTPNIQRLKELLGIASASGCSEVLHIWSEWARMHLAACGALIVGFLVGWKLG